MTKKINKGLKILLNMDLLNTYNLTPTQYCILYYTYNKLECSIGANMKNSLIAINMLNDVEGIELSETALSIFYEDPSTWSKAQLKEFLTALREHYPKGVKIAGNPVRTTIGDSTINKMKNFLKEYDFEISTIHEATIAYVKDRKSHNYAYMKKFTNFINKQGEDSLLASWCEMIIDGDNKQIRSDGRIERTL